MTCQTSRWGDTFDAPPPFDAANESTRRPAGETIDRALAWLADAPRPVFLWVHLFDPHMPYEPPPPFDAAFGDTAASSERLAERDILYAPDYVISAGGNVNVSVEFHDGGYDEEVALRKIERIPQALKELWTIAKEEDVPPCFAADRLAQRILAEGRAAKA